MSALGQKRTRAISLNHLVCLREQALWHDNPDCSRRWQVDDQFELGRLHDRHIAWFLALENTTCIDADLSIANEIARAITHKTANFDKRPLMCSRLMTTPGVGPVVALTYRATVDVPARFRKSKSVGAVFGLTCSRHQSGEIDWSGRISRCGDEMMRVMLYEAAQSMLRSKKWSWLKAWAMQIARRRGMKKAIVALARRLAVIMHRIWVDGTEFRWTREATVA